MGTVSQNVAVRDGFADSHSQSSQRGNVWVLLLGLRRMVHVSFGRGILHFCGQKLSRGCGF